MAKTKLGLICGGRSVEHEISLISAYNIIAALDQQKYELSVIGVARDGSFRLYQDAANFLNQPDDPNQVALQETGFIEVAWRVESVLARNSGQLLLLDGSAKTIHLDVVFPIMHGSYAEDGKMQGFLEMLNIPYVGPDVLASSISMDKAVTKELVSMAGVPVAPYLVFTAAQKATINYDQVVAKLGEVLFIKPANSGSSVGISKVTDQGSFQHALEQAFQVDHKILVEAAVVGREIECSVLGNQGALQAGEVGEIIPEPKHGFYSYDAKYVDEAGAKLLIPAELDGATRERVQTLAKQVFAILSCEGMARVDFFLTLAGEVVLNEINTIPGFTKISMYPKLMMAATGMSYAQLIDQLIELALERQQRNSKLLLEKKMVE